MLATRRHCFHAGIVALVTFCGSSLARSDSPLPQVADLPHRAEFPDPLITFQGQVVTTAEQWRNERRPELQRLFQHYMYGYFPRPERVTAQLDLRDDTYFDGRATKKLLTLRYGPPETPPIQLLLVIPNQRTGPAPVFVGLNFCGNHTFLDDPTIPLPKVWLPERCPGCEGNQASEAGRGTQIDIWDIRRTIERGFATATFYSGDVAPDHPGFVDGVFPHLSSPAPTPEQSWGAIAAWAYGLHRAVDYLTTDPDLDPRRIAAVGHSRLGKATLLAAAFDERIALAIPNQAGCGGTAPSRSVLGESVRAINDRFPHWFNDTFPRFNDEVERLPFDQHSLAALVAPRPVLFTNAVEDTWANPPGQFEMLRRADRVYRLLGVPGLGVDTPPKENQLVGGRLGYFVRPGKHSMTPADWDVYIEFARRHFQP